MISWEDMRDLDPDGLDDEPIMEKIIAPIYICQGDRDEITMPSGPDDEPKFKEGDRIRIIGDSIDNFEFFSLGAEGVVERICENIFDGSDLLVIFDTGEFMECDSEGNPSSWYVMNCDAELVT